MRALAALGVATAAAFAACVGTSSPGEQLEGRSDAVIYGEDDRVDVYASDDQALRDIAHASMVALVPRNRLLRPDSGGVQIVAPLLKDMLTKLDDNGQSYRLCPSEPFLDQRALADCTGVLIDDDLVLTAAHCFTETQQCEDYAFVFDYFERAEGELESVTSSDIYHCRSVVARKLTSDASPDRVDFAVVQLDRAPLGRKPLSAVGYPSGLPAKIDRGAKVIETRAAMHDFFFLNSDTFKGSSGSGIFDAQHRLAGILVRGSPDFELNTAGGCLVSNVVLDGGIAASGNWEEATYVTRAVEALCNEQYPSPRLCAITPRCGDGFCSHGENGASCADDCTEAACSTCTKARDPVLGDAVDGPDGGQAGAGDAGPGDAATDEAPGSKKPEGCAVAARGHADFASLALGLLAASLLWVRRRR
jgi:hypothetical protein